MKLLGLLSMRVSARGLAALLQAASLILLAHALSPSVFGAFTAAYSASIVGASLLGFGASTRILRMSAETSPAAGSGLFVLRMSGGIIGSGAGAVVLIWAPGMGYAVTAGAVFSIADAMVEFAQAYFAGGGRHVVSASLPVGLRLAQVGAVVGLAAESDPVVAYGASAASLAASVGYGYLLVRAGLFRNVGVLRPSALQALVRSSSGYWFSGVVANIRQLEPLVLLGAGSAALAGQYALVTRLANPLLIVPATLQLIFVPRLAASLDDGPSGAETMRRLWAFSGAYAAMLIVSAPGVALLLPTVLGPGYEGMFSLTVAVVAAAGLSTLAYVVQIHLIAAGKPWRSSLWIATYSLLGVAMLAGLAGAKPELIWIVPLVTQALLLLTLIRPSLWSRGTRQIRRELGTSLPPA